MRGVSSRSAESWGEELDSIRENKGDAHPRIIEMNEAITSKFLNLVIEVFSGYANLMIFKERENDILVRARKTIKPIFHLIKKDGRLRFSADEKEWLSSLYQKC